MNKKIKVQFPKGTNEDIVLQTLDFLLELLVLVPLYPKEETLYQIEPEMVDGPFLEIIFPDGSSDELVNASKSLMERFMPLKRFIPKVTILKEEEDYEEGDKEHITIYDEFDSVQSPVMEDETDDQEET